MAETTAPRVYDAVLAANAAYAGAFDKGDLALPPARRFAILRSRGRERSRPAHRATARALSPRHIHRRS